MASLESTAFPSQSFVLVTEYAMSELDNNGQVIGSEKSTKTMFSYTSLAVGRGAFVSAMRFKLSSVTDPLTSDVAKESYPEQNTFALISQEPSFKPFKKY
jgi:hypothetical protein